MHWACYIFHFTSQDSAGDWSEHMQISHVILLIQHVNRMSLVFLEHRHLRLKVLFSLFFDNPLFNCGYCILKPNHLSLLVILSINGGEEQQWLSLCYEGALKWMTQFLLISVATADSDWNQQPTQPAAPHCVFAGLLILVVEKGAVLWL